MPESRISPFTRALGLLKTCLNQKDLVKVFAMTIATDSETLSPLKIEPQSVETERPSVNITPDDGSHVPVAAIPPEKQKDAESEHLKDAKSGAQSGQVPLARSESFT